MNNPMMYFIEELTKKSKDNIALCHIKRKENNDECIVIKVDEKSFHIRWKETNSVILKGCPKNKMNNTLEHFIDNNEVLEYLNKIFGC